MNNKLPGYTHDQLKKTLQDKGVSPKEGAKLDGRYQKRKLWCGVQK